VKVNLYSAHSTVIVCFGPVRELTEIRLLYFLCYIEKMSVSCAAPRAYNQRHALMIGLINKTPVPGDLRGAPHENCKFSSAVGRGHAAPLEPPPSARLVEFDATVKISFHF
jgi:hypothetical protein